MWECCHSLGGGGGPIPGICGLEARTLLGIVWRTGQSVPTAGTYAANVQSAEVKKLCSGY